MKVHIIGDGVYAPVTKKSVFQFGTFRSKEGNEIGDDQTLIRIGPAKTVGALIRLESEPTTEQANEILKALHAAIKAAQRTGATVDVRKLIEGLEGCKHLLEPKVATDSPIQTEQPLPTFYEASAELLNIGFETRATKGYYSILPEMITDIGPNFGRVSGARICKDNEEVAIIRPYSIEKIKAWLETPCDGITTEQTAQVNVDAVSIESIQSLRATLRSMNAELEITPVLIDGKQNPAYSSLCAKVKSASEKIKEAESRVPAHKVDDLAYRQDVVTALGWKQNEVNTAHWTFNNATVGLVLFEDVSYMTSTEGTMKHDSTLQTFAAWATEVTGKAQATITKHDTGDNGDVKYNHKANIEQDIKENKLVIRALESVQARYFSRQGNGWNKIEDEIEARKQAIEELQSELSNA